VYGLTPFPTDYSDSPSDSILSRFSKRKKHKKNNKNPKNAVHFSSHYEQIHESPYHSMNSVGIYYEPYELWHKPAQYRAFREREIQITKQLSAAMPKMEFARDGIESIAYRKARKQRTDQAKFAVLKEQEDCWEGMRYLSSSSMEQADYIRQAYLRSSKMAGVLAGTRGKLLARQVLAFALVEKEEEEKKQQQS
jgi:hypothetical protein